MAGYVRGAPAVLWVLVVVGAVGGCAQESPAAFTRAALGEPRDGFPDWQERVVLVWTNRARSDPAADLAGCTVCAERACYSPVAPLTWDHNLGRAARFHSDNLVRGGCGLQHDSPCTLFSDISTRYRPGPCDGSPSCACTGGSAMCGSTGTAWSTRIGYFGTPGRAENIAAGRADPVGTFYMWLWEPDSNSACGWRSANGHRANILGGSRSLGVGRSSSTYTQDFGSSGTPDGIVSGVHYPQSGSSLDFRANWYRAATPTSAQVNVGGACSSMALERGTTTNGTYRATVTGISGCTRYYFHFRDGSGDVFFPTTGSFGIGCTDDWVATRPGVCGMCTPDCMGRVCGDDGCGGSCGSCSGGRVCSAMGTCQCPSGTTYCSGTCVDTNTDEAHCGGCGMPCAPGDTCVGATCMCVPSCAGRSCGSNGCGGSCGTCTGGQVCNASGSCVCPTGLTLCSGVCVDTALDESNCGRCRRTCRAGQFCVSGRCGDVCMPDCTGRMCGDNGCGGSCGTCSGGRTCNAAGACVCPMGQMFCSGACVDTSTSTSHCGGCGMACAPGDTCTSGRCTGSCVPDCTGRVCGSDGCGGSCGACSRGRVCDMAGACVCPMGTTDCGACVNTDTDPANCGGCARPCGASETCMGGACTCVPACTGRSCGDDGCGGSCGTCAAGRVCAAGGTCVCGASLTNCGGECVDVRTDARHCGGCSMACPAGEACVASACTTAGPDAGCMPACAGRDCGDDTCGGTCGGCTGVTVCAGGVCTCAEGTMDCGGECVDTRSDARHCGGCDTPCAVGGRCVAGACEGEPDAGMPDGGTGDAGVGTDGGTTPFDAAASGDAGEVLRIEGDGGCGCRVSEQGTGTPHLAVISWLVALLLWRRRRR